MFAVAIKEFRELFRDHRTLGLLFGLPIVLLIIFGYAANFTVDRVSVAVVGAQAQAAVDFINDIDDLDPSVDIVLIDESMSEADVDGILKAGDADAVIVTRADRESGSLIEQGEFAVDGSEIFPAQASVQVFQRLLIEEYSEQAASAQTDLDDMQSRLADAREGIAEARESLDDLTGALEAVRAAPTPENLAALSALQLPDLAALDADLGDDSDLQLPDPAEMSEHFSDGVTMRFNPDLHTSWVMIPGLVGLILTFVATVITSIGLVRERESGTMEQLAVMPLRPFSIIIGKIAPYFLIAALDMVIITLLGMFLFDVPFEGSVLLMLTGSAVFLLVVLGLGVLISTVSTSTGQAVQLAILVVLPQVLLSGLIFPLEAMADGVRWIGYALPLTWFIEIARGVMLRGADFPEEILPLAILAGMAVVMFGLALVRMHRLLRRGGA
ncbi:ABC transporter permease [Microbacterium amylolyticum]|uniref:ABC-2 type transport system permease protein n=1 Tax=Microbacterium amylolyticum TaxID=936337 RepID=A0ABS4ZJR9_9MICO|nr:ABC transporter permease [Microbacterium amylolyticum]MBP2436711.1 ABC-2 type transport system permease protein [Microbacterium amylolyticum]